MDEQRTIELIRERMDEAIFPYMGLDFDDPEIKSLIASAVKKVINELVAEGVIDLSVPHYKITIDQWGNYAIDASGRLWKGITMEKTLLGLQKRYETIAKTMGFDNESPVECVVLMVEEIGELARAIRKREGLFRASQSFEDIGEELADVIIYCIHLANTLGIDLTETINEKMGRVESRPNCRKG